MRPHVTHVLARFDTGGVGAQACLLAKALINAGVSSSCLALRKGGALCAQRLGIPANDAKWEAGPRHVLGGLMRLRRALAQEGATVVHVHGPGALLATRIAIAARRGEVELWFTWHDSSSLPRRRTPREAAIRRAIRSCDVVLASSRRIAESLEQISGRPVRVLRNGVPQTPPSQCVGDSPPKIVWAGRLVPPKRPDAILDIAAHLQQSGILASYVLAGSAPPRLAWYEEQLKERIVARGLQSIVELPGWIEDLQTLNANASIAVQTSETEGLSIALLEQMMAGLAIVATDVGDTASAIIDDETGILVPPNDTEALISAMRGLVQDAGLRCRLGTAARARALEAFSLGSMAEAYLSLMGRVHDWV